MQLKLDPKSPTPLYHQIVESLRYRIGTGVLTPGSPLPAVRKAAAAWGVNLHTVRKAYGVLAEEGLVEIKGALGTRVADSSAVSEASGPSRELASFLSRTLEEATENFQLSPEQLARHLKGFRALAASTPSTVHMVECSEAQCAAHAAEIETNWNVEARPFSLDGEGEPPDGPVIATYFHFNQIRQRWPHRLADIHFVAIHPDPGLAEQLTGAANEPQPCTILLCEFDTIQAQGVAADLRVFLPADRFRVETRVVQRANELLHEAGANRHLLFTPRVWAGLTQQEQATPYTHPLIYVIKTEELAGLGQRFGWSERLHPVAVT